jgi:hypothetical protein
MDEYLSLLERLSYEQPPERLPVAVRLWCAGFRKAWRKAGDDLLTRGEKLPAKQDSPTARAMKADEARTPRDWQKRQATPKPKGG